MRIGYFDCFSGASGDMILAACLDAGLDLDILRADLAELALKGYAIDAHSICKQGFAATQFEVILDTADDLPHRHLKHIQEIIDNSRLPQRISTQALAIFEEIKSPLAEESRHLLAELED